MKKRILIIILALTMIFSATIPTLAVDVTTAGDTNSTLTYSVSSSYTVTIPESAITITKSDGYEELGAPVKVAAGMLLNHGQKLMVKLYSGNVTDNKFQLKLESDASTKVDYSIQIVGDPATDVTAGANAGAAATILEVMAGTTAETSVQLQYKITGTPTKSGSFKDTLTFAVSVN